MGINFQSIVMEVEKNEYVDFHCHPALKPFGKSFNRKPVGRNTHHRNRNRSIWKYNPPSVFDKLLNFVTGLTKFSQSNFSSLAYGGVHVICASLYPFEKQFFRNKMKNELLLDIMANFATGIGKKRVDHIQGITNYFKDLQRELDYYRQLDGKIIRLPEGKFRYKLVKNYTEIEAIRLWDKNNKTTTICVILSIEGMHVLNENLHNAPDENRFLANVRQLKNWETSPFFVTVAHHFWNHLCGHAPSLAKAIRNKVDQSEGLGAGFKPLGIKVVKALLDDKNGKRILIDVKHMSPAARKVYYQLLENTPAYQNVPIIVSHGAANGLKSFENPIPERLETASKLNPSEINFYDEELIRIAGSNGIFALQLDERRIVSKATLKATKNSVKRNKIMHYRSELLWNQIRHITEVLDGAGLFAWDCLALGTDFDGIIDPLNSFWTAEEIPYLADFLERHVHNHMQNHHYKHTKNVLDADTVIERIFSSNAHRFLQQYFI